MKGTQRQKYLNLLEPVEGHYGLCTFCKFAEWTGGMCDSDLFCTHPLPIINEGDGRSFSSHPHEVWGEGVDCWAFRPSRKFEEIAMFVGIFLEGNIPHISDTYSEIIAIIPSQSEKELFW